MTALRSGNQAVPLPDFAVAAAPAPVLLPLVFCVGVGIGVLVAVSVLRLGRRGRSAERAFHSIRRRRTERQVLAARSKVRSANQSPAPIAGAPSAMKRRLNPTSAASRGAPPAAPPWGDAGGMSTTVSRSSVRSMPSELRSSICGRTTLTRDRPNHSDPN